MPDLAPHTHFPVISELGFPTRCWTWSPELRKWRWSLNGKPRFQIARCQDSLILRLIYVAIDTQAVGRYHRWIYWCWMKPAKSRQAGRCRWGWSRVCYATISLLKNSNQVGRCIQLCTTNAVWWWFPNGRIEADWSLATKCGHPDHDLVLWQCCAVCSDRIQIQKHVYNNVCCSINGS